LPLLTGPVSESKLLIPSSVHETKNMLNISMDIITEKKIFFMVIPHKIENNISLKADMEKLRIFFLLVNESTENTPKACVWHTKSHDFMLIC
jgi:hypothetical protein